MTPPRFTPVFVDFSRRTMQDEIDDLKRARALRVFLILALITWALVSTLKLIDVRHQLAGAHHQLQEQRVERQDCAKAFFLGTTP